MHQPYFSITFTFFSKFMNENTPYYKNWKPFIKQKRFVFIDEYKDNK